MKHIETLDSKSLHFFDLNVKPCSQTASKENVLLSQRSRYERTHHDTNRAVCHALRSALVWDLLQFEVASRGMRIEGWTPREEED